MTADPIPTPGSMLIRAAAVFLIVLTALPIFSFGFAGLRVEWARPAFAYGPLIVIAAVCVFFWIARANRAVPASAVAPWMAAPGLFAALMIAVLGSFVRIDDVIFLGMFLWGFCLIWLLSGFRVALGFWPGFVLMALAMPLPKILHDKIFGPLQDVSVGVGLNMLRLGGGFGAREGTDLVFSGGALPVEEAASSLVALAPALAAAGIVALLGKGPRWARAAFVMAAPVVVVFLTTLRVGLLGVVSGLSGAASAEMLLRLTGPAATFAGVAVILLALRWSLAWAGVWAFRWRDVSQGGRTAVPVVWRGFRTRLAPIMLAAAASVIVAAGYLLAPGPSEGRIARADFGLFPPEIDDWFGSKSALSDRTEFTLGADDYISANFFHPDERAPVDFFSAYYFDQNRERGNIHSPEVCLPNDGWTIEDLRQVTIPLDSATVRSISVNRAVIRRGPVRNLALYWFEGRGRSMSDPLVWQLFTKIDVFRLGRADGAIVRVVTPILEDETEADAEARLLRFLSSTVDQLPRFIPE